MRERSRQLQTSTTSVTGNIRRDSGPEGHALTLQGTITDVTSNSPSSWQATSDVVTPNFHSRIAAGAVINNPFVSRTVTESFVGATGYDHWYGQTKNVWYEGTLHNTIHHNYGVFKPSNPPGYLSDPSGVTVDSVKGLAVTQAYSNIDESSMLALATAAESRKTVDSMVNIMGRAFRIFRNVRKLNAKALLNEIRPHELADRYMEARYAIRPLIYDVNGIARALQSKRRHIRKTYRGYSDGSASHADMVNDRSYAWLSVCDWQRQSELTVSARAGVLCDVEIDEITTWGVDQLATTLWELAPFSFIADWFCNMGDLIAAHSPKAGVSQLASWVTVRTKRTRTQKVVAVRSTATGYTNHYSISISGGGNSSTWEELVLERVVAPRLDTFPRFDVNLDVFKLTDLSIIGRNILR